MEGFEEPVRPGAVMLQDWTQPPDAASSSSFLRIPRWMRTGEAPTAVWTGRSIPVPMAIGGCGARRWRPSQLMGRTGEERRRLLYPLMQQVACEAGLPVGLFDAMLIQESRYNPFATSVKGAFGLGQLMPGTARNLRVDRYDLRGNLTGAARYLKAHLTEFGRVDLALAAYNAGPGRVRASDSVPSIRETRGYVATILANWRTLEERVGQNF